MKCGGAFRNIQGAFGSDGYDGSGGGGGNDSGLRVRLGAAAESGSATGPPQDSASNARINCSMRSARPSFSWVSPKKVPRTEPFLSIT